MLEVIHEEACTGNINIYKLKCSRCPASIIGKTGEKRETFFKQVFEANDAIKTHETIPGHKIKIENMEKMLSCRDENKPAVSRGTVYQNMRSIKTAFDKHYAAERSQLISVPQNSSK